MDDVIEEVSSSAKPPKIFSNRIQNQTNGMGARSKRHGTPGKNKRRSKYSGAAINAEVSAALGGVRGKSNDALFFEDKRRVALPARAAARKRRDAEEAQEAADALRAPSLAAQRLITRTADSIEACARTGTQRGPHIGRRRSRPTSACSSASGMRDVWADGDLTAMANRGRARRVHKHKSTTNLVAAVEVVHAGASYNPTLVDMRAGLAQTVERLAVFNTKKNKISRPAGMAEMQERMARKRKQEATRGRVARDVDEDEDEESSDSESEEEEESEKAAEEEEEEQRAVGQLGSRSSGASKGGKAGLAPGERITRVQRNKEKRKRGLERARREKLALKAQRDELDRVGEHVEHLQGEEDAAEKRAEMKKERAEQRLREDPLPKVGGRNVLVAPRVEAVLPSDLSDNMRTLKPHGGFLLDRFNSLHKRNLVEVGDVKKRLRYVDLFVGLFVACWFCCCSCGLSLSLSLFLAASPRVERMGKGEGEREREIRDGHVE